MSVQTLQQTESAASDNSGGNCPKCNIHLAAIADLKAQLAHSSDDFARAVSQIKNSRDAKSHIAEMDEQFIAQCVRDKVEAEKKQAHYQQTILQLKTQAQQKLSALIGQAQKQQVVLNNRIKQAEQTIEKLTSQLETQRTRVAVDAAEKDRLHRQQLVELKQQYEQKISQLSEQAEQKLRNYAQQLSKTKVELAQVNESVAVKTRQTVRAEELNARLLEQCNMAKLGADTEITEKAKDFALQVNKLKANATKQINGVAAENTKIKKAAQNALQKASHRIKTLEHAINCLNETASSIQSS